MRHKIKKLPFRQLEIFHAVMMTQSVMSASKLLGVSQPSLSRSLRRLEDQLDIKLFERVRQRLVPTQEALRIVTEVDATVRHVAALTGAITKIAEGQSALFRFAATQSVGRSIVPRAVRDLISTNPGLEIFLDSLPQAQHVEYLTSGAGECIVTLAEVEHPLARMRTIGRAPLVALVPRNHRLARSSLISAGSFADAEIIGFEHNGPHSDAIAAFFAKASLPKTPAHVRFADAAIALASEGVAIALVDDFTASGTLPATVRRVPLKNAPKFTARLYWNSERSISRYVGVLGDALVECVNQRRPC